jgi:hypothetical protein
VSDNLWWSERTRNTYARVKSEMLSMRWSDHPLTGYMRAQAEVDGLIRGMEIDDTVPPGILWDARAVRDALARLESRAGITGLIRDALWTLNVTIAASTIHNVREGEERGA